jgi:hypothetical protein
VLSPFLAVSSECTPDMLCRSFITSKGDAFAAPFGFPDAYAFENGDLSLSEYELALSNAYSSLGRPDLAECVKRGKKYQYLFMLLYGESTTIAMLNGMRRAFLGQDSTIVEEPGTMEEWVEAARDQYGPVRMERGLEED